MTEYKNNLPNEEINYPDNSPTKQLLSLILSLILILFLISIGINFSGKLISPLIPLSFKKSISNHYINNLTQSESIKNYEQKNSYSQKLFQEILQVAQVSDPSQWELRFINSPIPAATFPGKIIIISDELLKYICSANALSFVLGHEVAHAYYQHPEESLGKIIPTLILSSIFSMNNQTIIESVKNLFDLKNSRDHEKQADNFSKKIMLKIYGHLKGSDEFFVKIKQERKGELFHWFSTHPNSQSRIDNLKDSKNGKIYILPKGIRNEECNI